MYSDFLKLNGKDLGKGFIVAVITALVTTLYQWATSVPVHFPNTSELGTAALTAVMAGVSYLLKNFVTNSEGTPLKTEDKATLPH